MRSPLPEPPRFPESYGKIDLDGRAADADWRVIHCRLEEARNYWLATTRGDGRPHVVPVWAVWFEQTLCFGTDPDSQKARNLRIQPAVSVHLESGDDVVVVEGLAAPLIDPDVIRQFVVAFAAKYDVDLEPELDKVALFAVRPRIVHSWDERNFHATAWRWRFPDG